MSKCNFTTDLYQLTNLEKTFPENPDLYYAIAKLYHSRYRWERTLEYLQKAEKYWEGNKDNLFLEYGKAYKQLKKYEKSVEYYSKVADEKIEEDIDHLSLFARAYLELEKYEDSKKYYEKALKQQPENTWYLNNFAWCLIKLDRYDLALEELLKVESLAPKDAWALGKIGLCYQEVEDYTTALKYHEKAKSLGTPEKPWNEGCIAWCNFALGDLQKAKHTYEELFKQERKNYQLMNMGHIYLCENNFDGAMDFYKESLKKYDTTKGFKKDFLEDFRYITSHQVISEEKYKQILEDLIK